MKTIILTIILFVAGLVLFALSGCVKQSNVQSPRSKVEDMVPPAIAATWGLRDEPLIETPVLYHCYWTPGGYTNFLVVTATNLPAPQAEWTTWLETDQTNFDFAAAEARRFFAVCGTNKVTGEYAWAGSAPY